MNIRITGHIAEEVWQNAQSNPADFYGTADVADDLATLGDSTSSNDVLVQAVISILEKLRG